MLVCRLQPLAAEQSCSESRRQTLHPIRLPLQPWQLRIVSIKSIESNSGGYL